MLSLHDSHELLTILSLDFFEPQIIVCELSLAGDVKLLELDFVSLPLRLLSLLVLDLCLLVGFLGPDLIKSSSTVLSLLLHLSHALYFNLFFLFKALIFPRLRLFSLQGPPLVICDLLIKVHFGLPGGRFLRKGVLIRDFDLVVHDLDSS